jgi:hypothetical protein
VVLGPKNPKENSLSDPWYREITPHTLRDGLWENLYKTFSST